MKRIEKKTHNWVNHRSENFNKDIDMFAINRITEMCVNQLIIMASHSILLT